MNKSNRHEFHDELVAFARYTRTLIRKARWTQAQFAKHLGVNSTTVWRWSNGLVFPSLRLRRKMKLLDDKLGGRMSKEDQERHEHPAPPARKREPAPPKPQPPKRERLPGQLVARADAPVVNFELDDEEQVNG